MMRMMSLVVAVVVPVIGLLTSCDDGMTKQSDIHHY